jgi:hypothetical protein
MLKQRLILFTNVLFSVSGIPASDKNLLQQIFILIDIHVLELQLPQLLLLLLIQMRLHVGSEIHLLVLTVRRLYQQVLDCLKIHFLMKIPVRNSHTLPISGDARNRLIDCEPSCLQRWWRFSPFIGWLRIDAFIE